MFSGEGKHDTFRWSMFSGEGQGILSVGARSVAKGGHFQLELVQD